MRTSMEKKTEQIHPDQWLKDLPNEPEIQRFDSDAMIHCEKCGRKSPPTRLKCLYCGTNLTVSAEQAEFLKPSLRKMDEWEKGFNIILKPGNSLENENEIAGLIHLEVDDLRKITAAGIELPLARSETLIEAEFLAKKLGEFGLASRIVGDEILDSEKPPRRIRGLEFRENSLLMILVNTNETSEIAFSDLKLIVVGAAFDKTIEEVEKVKKKDEGKKLGATEISSDEILVDIYGKDDSFGWRIGSKGFDFSCLGTDKGLFAKDNMPKIIDRLKSLSAEIEFDEDYLKFREELGKVWSVSQTTDSGGFQRSGLLGFKRSSVTKVTNVNQFTRYSRLRRHKI